MKTLSTFFLKLLVVQSAFFLTQCAYGPKEEKKSPLNYLSGEHYESHATIAGVPIVERKVVPTVISGKVLLANGPIPVPLKFQELMLKRSTEEILKSKTDSEGNFKFSGRLSNGDYSISLLSEKYSLESKITVDSYKVEGLVLTARELSKK